MKSTIGLIILFVNVCFGCNHIPKGGTKAIQQEKVQKLEMSYKDAIDTISKKVVDLTSIYDLFYFEEFIKIYEQPDFYKKDAIVFISDSANGLQEKQIAVYSMQNLTDTPYIDFCSSLLELYKKNAVDSDVLKAAIFRSINKKFQIIRNYGNSSVINLLKAYSATCNNYEATKRIEEILSGKYWSGLQEFLNNNN